MFWAAISWEGASPLVAITHGTLDSDGYIMLLRQAAQPFLSVSFFLIIFYSSRTNTVLIPNLA